MTLGHFVQALLDASADSLIVVAAILTLQHLFRKWLTPQWRYALWWLLLLRLLLLFVVIPIDPSFHNPPPAGVVSVAPEQGVLHSVATVSRTFADKARRRVGPVDTWAFLGPAWCLGALGLAVVMAIQSLRLRRAVSSGQMLKDQAALDLLETCRSTMGLRAWLVPVETRAATGPLLLGVVRPKLLLPPGFVQRVSREQLRHIFLHELAHLRRADIWAGWLMNVLFVMHWFNPVLWLIRRRILNDRECACDATALKRLDAPGQIAYGRTLLDLAQHAFPPARWSPGMASILETSSNLQRRIEMITAFPRKRMAAIVGAAVTLALGAVCLSTLAASTEIKYTHLVVFEPAGDFHPSTPRELLDVFNGVCHVPTGYFRTAPQNGKLVGSICANQPERLQKDLAEEPRLKWIKADPLTPKLFATHSARRQESLPAPQSLLPGAYSTPKGAYTHLVTFKPVGDFRPKTPRDLLTVFNGVCRVPTGYFRTRPQDGKLFGSICTNDPENLKKDLAKEPRLEFINAAALTPKTFAEHTAKKQQSLP